MTPKQRTGQTRPMTWLVKVALDRPYTFIVMALMILIFGPPGRRFGPRPTYFPISASPVVGRRLQLFRPVAGRYEVRRIRDEITSAS